MDRTSYSDAMTPNLKTWQPHFEEVEGRVNHFYLDGADIVTIGIGCQVFDLLTLTMFHKDGTVTASRSEIMSDYNAVKSMRAGAVPAVYGAVCRLLITESAIDQLFDARLMACIREVELEGLDLENTPDSAVLAVVDMAFNLGTYGLISKFPKFINAFKNHDWHTCALECKREGIQASRNEWTREIFEGWPQWHRGGRERHPRGPLRKDYRDWHAVVHLCVCDLYACLLQRQRGDVAVD